MTQFKEYIFQQCFHQQRDEWATGSYILESESRREDLAGNNLNRPFDRDIQQHSKKSNSVNTGTNSKYTE